MRRILLAVALGAATIAGCDGASPPRAPEGVSTERVRPETQIQSFAGQTYDAFAAEPQFQRYSIAALSPGEASRERFEHAMANRAVGVLVSGGGSQALVFSGCAPSGCLEGLSVIAIDTQTGEVFAGVSDMAGQERLVENVRLEALLRLTSPSQTWDDPVRPALTP
jgi:hypothetical protein